MKFTLTQLKAEKALKDLCSSLPQEPLQLPPAFILPKKEKKVIDRDGKCQKHGPLHLQCARLGSRRTKANRWRRNGDRVFSGGGFISDQEMNKLESLYKQAKDNFHREPCTCPVSVSPISILENEPTSPEETDPFWEWSGFGI